MGDNDVRFKPSTLLTAFGTTPRDVGLIISRLVRSNSSSGREAAGLDELQHLTLSELEECAASAEQTAAALPSLSIWERRHRVSEVFTRAPHQPGSKAAERAVKARLWNLIGVTEESTNMSQFLLEMPHGDRQPRVTLQRPKKKNLQDILTLRPLVTTKDSDGYSNT